MKVWLLIWYSYDYDSRDEYVFDSYEKAVDYRDGIVRQYLLQEAPDDSDDDDFIIEFSEEEKWENVCFLLAEFDILEKDVM